MTDAERPSPADGVHEIEGSWRRASGPFWRLEGAACRTLRLKDRGGSRCPVVAVFHPARNDCRLKIWLEDEGTGSFDDCAAVRIRGFDHEFAPRYLGNGLHQAGVDSRRLYRCLHGLPPEIEAEEDGGEEESGAGFLDVCIRTEFAESAGERGRGGLPGTLEGVPRWMRAESISISHPDTGGGWPGIRLRAPGIPIEDSIHGTGVAAMRVNGVWMLAMPVADATDERGWTVYGGTWSLLCDPISLEEARSGGAELLPPEPMPPREVHLLRKLHRSVGLPRRQYEEWRDAIVEWRNCVIALCGLQGRWSYCAWHSGNSRGRMKHYERLLDAGFKRYAAAGGPAKSMEDLIGSLRGTKLGSKLGDWRRRRIALQSSHMRHRIEAEELERDIGERRELHDRLLIRLEEFEDRYADAIEFLSAVPE